MKKRWKRRQRWNCHKPLRHPELAYNALSCNGAVECALTVDRIALRCIRDPRALALNSRLHWRSFRGGDRKQNKRGASKNDLHAYSSIKHHPPWNVSDRLIPQMGIARSAGQRKRNEENKSTVVPINRRHIHHRNAKYALMHTTDRLDVAQAVTLQQYASTSTSHPIIQLSRNHVCRQTTSAAMCQHGSDEAIAMHKTLDFGFGITTDLPWLTQLG